MTEEEEKSVSSIAVFFALIIVPFSVFLNAYTLSYLWLWFIVPLGVPVIGMVHALGLIALKGFLTFNFVAPKTENGKSLADKVVSNTVKSIAVPLTTLALGFIYHSFM
jgi:hypothetical protein